MWPLQNDSAADCYYLSRSADNVVYLSLSSVDTAAVGSHRDRVIISHRGGVAQFSAAQSTCIATAGLHGHCHQRSVASLVVDSTQ